MRTGQFSSSSNVTLYCLQGSLAGGRSAQFMCIIHMKTASGPGGLSSGGQIGKPNSI